MLLNLLIAIMSDTYARYSESMTGAWRMQQAMFILAEQERLNNNTYQEKYHVDKLWVLDEDKPVEGLAHFNANTDVWKSVSDTNNDAPIDGVAPRKLRMHGADGQLHDAQFPRVVESSTILLGGLNLPQRQALLTAFVERMGSHDP